MIFPPFSNSTTSREAAQALAGTKHIESMSNAVYRLIREESDGDGQTAQDLQHRLATPGDTIRPRIWELVKAGKVYDSGERRTLPSGRKAIIWRAR